MSTIFPLPHSDRILGPFTATGGQTDFPGSFGIQDDNDLIVRRTRAGLVSALVLDVDYEVLSVDNPDGFTVRLLAAAQAGDVINGWGAAVIERTTSVVQAGSFNSRQLDRELDRSRIIDMELSRRVDETQAAVEAVPGLIDAEMAAHVAADDPHPQYLTANDATQIAKGDTGDGVPHYSSVAALRLANTLGVSPVMVGDALWKYSAASFAADDGVNFIIDNAGRRYVRVDASTVIYDSIAAMLADAREFADGKKLIVGVSGGWMYEVSAAVADLVRADGRHLKVLTPELLAFGCIADGVVDDTALVNKAIARFAGQAIYVPFGVTVKTTLTQTQLRGAWFTGGGLLNGNGARHLTSVGNFSLPSPSSTTAGGRVVVVGNPESVELVDSDGVTPSSTGNLKSSGVILGGRGAAFGAVSYQQRVGPNAELYTLGGAGDSFMDQLAGVSFSAHAKLIKSTANGGSHGFAGGGTEAMVAGDYAGAGWGSFNSALGSWSVIVGGNRNTVGVITDGLVSQYSAIVCGLSGNVENATFSFIPNGRNALVQNAAHAQASGYQAKAHQDGMRVHQSRPFTTSSDPLTAIRNECASFQLDFSRELSGANSGSLQPLYINNSLAVLAQIEAGYMWSGDVVVQVSRSDVVQRGSWVIAFQASNTGGVVTLHWLQKTVIGKDDALFDADVVGSANGNILQVRGRTVTNAVTRWAAAMRGSIVKM